MIGFSEVDSLYYGNYINNIRITNPDGRTNYIINLKDSLNQEFQGVLTIVSKYPTYKGWKGGLMGLFSTVIGYATWGFYEVERINEVYTVKNNQNPILIDIKKVEKSFYNQVGRNTSYVLAIDEILADNFAFLLRSKLNPSLIDKKSGRDLEVLKSMEGFLNRQ